MEEWKKMISVANIFSDSIQMLEVLKKAISKEKNCEFDYLSKTTNIPVIVLKAFACEMYLKSYLSKDGSISIPRRHNLYELYRNLSRNTKSKVNRILLDKMKISNKDYKQLDIDLDISKVANAFEEWRYFYEGDYSIDLYFLNAFYDTLNSLSRLPQSRS